MNLSSWPLLPTGTYYNWHCFTNKHTCTQRHAHSANAHTQHTKHFSTGGHVFLLRISCWAAPSSVALSGYTVVVDSTSWGKMVQQNHVSSGAENRVCSFHGWDWSSLSNHFCYRCITFFFLSSHEKWLNWFGWFGERFKSSARVIPLHEKLKGEKEKKPDWSKYTPYQRQMLKV